jgi:nucleoprotein TPR
MIVFFYSSSFLILVVCTRNADVTEQNKILHDQFESISTRINALKDQPPAESEPAGNATTEGEATRNLSEVIRYLRREKDILDREHEIATQKTVRMQQQIDHLQRSLDETRALLDSERQKSQDSSDSKKMHTELLEKIDSLNILRESNSTLRSQNEINHKRIKLLEQRVKEKEAENGPLKEQNLSLKAEVETLRSEMKALEEDNGRWKARTQQILAKYERIDPVEHQRLKDEVTSLTTAKAALEAELKVAQAKVDELSNNTAALSGRLNLLTNQLTDMNGKLSASNNEIARLKSEAERAAQSSQVASKEEIETLKKQLEEAAESKKQLVSRSNEIGKKQRDRILNMTAQIQELTKQKSDLEVALANSKSAQDAQSTDNARLQLLESENQQLKSKIAECEAKIKQLSARAGSIAPAPQVVPATPAPAAGIQLVQPAVAAQTSIPTIPSQPSSVITPSPTIKRQREEEAAEVAAAESVARAPSVVATTSVAEIAVAVTTTAQEITGMDEPVAKRQKVESTVTAEIVPEVIPTPQQPQTVEEASEPQVIMEEISSTVEVADVSMTEAGAPDEVDGSTQAVVEEPIEAAIEPATDMSSEHRLLEISNSTEDLLSDLVSTDNLLVEDVTEAPKDAETTVAQNQEIESGEITAEDTTISGNEPQPMEEGAIEEKNETPEVTGSQPTSATPSLVAPTSTSVPAAPAPVDNAAVSSPATVTTTPSTSTTSTTPSTPSTAPVRIMRRPLATPTLVSEQQQQPARVFATPKPVVSTPAIPVTPVQGAVSGSPVIQRQPSTPAQPVVGTPSSAATTAGTAAIAPTEVKTPGPLVSPASGSSVTPAMSQAELGKSMSSAILRYILTPWTLCVSISFD